MTWYRITPSSSRVPSVAFAAKDVDDLATKVETHLRRHKALTPAKTVTTVDADTGQITYRQALNAYRSVTATVRFTKES